jgi:hypothetical protein
MNPDTRRALDQMASGDMNRYEDADDLFREIGIGVTPMPYPTCKTCDHWDTGDVYPGVAKKGDCGRIVELRDKDVEDPAWTDSTGADITWLATEPTFGCNLHSDFETTS